MEIESVPIYMNNSSKALILVIIFFLGRSSVIDKTETDTVVGTKTASTYFQLINDVYIYSRYNYPNHPDLLSAFKEEMMMILFSAISLLS